MKENYEFMPSRKLKEFFKLIKEQYGKVPDVFEKLAFVKGKDKVYVLSRDVGEIDLKNLRINSLGLYIAEVKNTQLRLSIEGAQLIGPSASKNIVEISDEQFKDWFKGADLKVDGDFSGFVILKHKNDFVGSGKFKDGYVLNFVPKARRLIEVH
ncbi:hypothetical protein KY319_03505 [Candidatus Woesearchaeota archaeon]|nr:hypothetical protein [Candidatus Woesearchaeota archaeon]